MADRRIKKEIGLKRMVEWKKLGDVCSLKARIGWQGLTQKEHKKTGDYLLVTGTDFKSNYQVDFDHCVYVDEIRYTQDPNIQLRPNDVLITKDGTLGKMAVIEDLPKPATLNGGLFVIRDTTGRIHHKFLLHYMLSSKFQSIIESNHTNGTIKHLTQALLTNFPFPIPSLQEQERIVGILYTFTASIENLKEQIAQRRKQYEHYRDQLLDLEGKDVQGTLSFGNDFQLKARIGWQGLTKREYRTNGDYKLVTGTDFTSNLRIDFDNCVYVDKERYEQDDNIKLKIGDVLITKDGTLGKVAYIDKLEMPATLNGGVFVVRDPMNRVLPKFTMYYLTSNHFKKWMKQNHTTGSIQHLTQKLLSGFTIPVVEQSEQSHIVSILDTFEASIANLEAQLSQREKQYEYYRNKLLTFE